MKVLGDLVSAEGTPADMQTGCYSLHSHRAEGRGGSMLSLGSVYKGTNPIYDGSHPHGLIVFQRPRFQTQSPWELFQWVPLVQGTGMSFYDTSP